MQAAIQMGPSDSTLSIQLIGCHQTVTREACRALSGQMTGSRAGWILSR
jgi:hypothetical protein